MEPPNSGDYPTYATLKPMSLDSAPVVIFSQPFFDAQPVEPEIQPGQPDPRDQQLDPYQSYNDGESTGDFLRRVLSSLAVSPVPQPVEAADKSLVDYSDSSRSISPTSTHQISGAATPTMPQGESTENSEGDQAETASIPDSSRSESIEYIDLPSEDGSTPMPTEEAFPFLEENFQPEPTPPERKRGRGRPRKKPMPKLMIGEDEAFEVEEIQNVMFCHNEKKKLYLVKWKNFSDADRTWEPIDGLIYAQDALEAFRTSDRGRTREVEADLESKQTDGGFQNTPIRMSASPTRPSGSQGIFKDLKDEPVENVPKRRLPCMSASPTRPSGSQSIFKDLKDEPVEKVPKRRLSCMSASPSCPSGSKIQKYVSDDEEEEHEPKEEPKEWAIGRMAVKSGSKAVQQQKKKMFKSREHTPSKPFISAASSSRKRYVHHDEEERRLRPRVAKMKIKNVKRDIHGDCLYTVQFENQTQRCLLTRQEVFAIDSEQVVAFLEDLL